MGTAQAGTLPAHPTPRAVPAVQVESTQSMIRIVGLSATLPNYRDVGRFLGVNNDTGERTPGYFFMCSGCVDK